MTNRRRWPNNSLSSEKSLKHAYSSDACLRGAVPPITGPITALYGIFSRRLILEYPPQIRGIGGPDGSQNESFSRRRPQGHAKSYSRTVSSYAKAGRLRPLLLGSLRLWQGLPAMAPRSPQALSPERRYQLRPAVRILVPQDEWNIALISAQRQGRCEGKNTATLACDPNASAASPTRLSHRNTSFAEEPCGNDGIDAHVEKRWRTSASVHGPYEAQIGSPPFPHNRFENSFARNPCRSLGMFRRRSFQQSLGKPCSGYVNANRPESTTGKPKLPFFHDGFPTLPQGLLLLIFYFRERRRSL